MKRLLFVALALAICAAPELRAQDSDAKAKQIARDLWKASGGENWGKVKHIKFTFIVEQEDKQLVSAQHDWNVEEQIDRVKWKDKNVRVFLTDTPTEDDQKAGFSRWTNDSYWLLAPLKVLDPGVKLAYEGQKDVSGTMCETLRLSFEQVGMTPTDQYVFYIDPKTKLLRAWDYIGKDKEPMHGTWENYIDHGGLKLATMHNFGGRIIRFADVEVAHEVKAAKEEEND